MNSLNISSAHFYNKKVKKNFRERENIRPKKGSMVRVIIFAVHITLDELLADFANAVLVQEKGKIKEYKSELNKKRRV
jgi:hypothetical protein